MNGKPFLVTGAHRTGTTWVGKMLAASGEAAYISEPLNIWHRPGVLRARVGNWYQYLCPENEASFLVALQETLAFKYHLGREILSLRSRKDFLRMCRDESIFFKGRLFNQRPLLKDPFAIFSIPWFITCLNCQVVVTVRHPAGFASSLKKLGWPFDFRHLLDQPLLMDAYLEPYRRQMEACLAQPEDIIAQSSLLWLMIYTTVANFRKQFPEIIITRHEDLAQDPVKGYQNLYRQLGLSFNASARNSILNSSSSENPRELKQVHATRLDSRASLNNWKRRLTLEEIQSIRSLTEEVASQYYESLDWGE